MKNTRTQNGAYFVTTYNNKTHHKQWFLIGPGRGIGVCGLKRIHKTICLDGMRGLEEHLSNFSPHTSENGVS